MRLRPVLLAGLAAIFAATLSIAPPAVGETRAATPDLTLVSNARYEVQPENALVRVTVDIVATNHLKDTKTRRYYFDRAFLAVLPGTTGFKLTSETGKPSVRVSQKRKDYQVLALGFGQRIYSGKSAKFRLTFNLPDPGGAATRDVRIGTALVSFPAWAFASESTPGSTVSVVFPKGYTIQLEAGELPEPTTDADGRTVFASGKLDSPLTFFAYFVADRPGSYKEASVTTPVGETTARLTIRAWPDDPDWAKRVTSLFERGLPALHELIGLPWSRTEPLVVQETVSRTTGGYAGLFDPREGRVEVAYYADAFVVLHEAAHAWFNGALLADRWANEAFASYYAQSAGGKLEEPIKATELTDELRKAAIPLNAWGAASRGDSATEDYGYAASLELATAIARRAGHDGLRRVWAAAAARRAPYQAPPVDASTSRPPDTVDSPPDWRGLLDLLEDQTGEGFDDLWRIWVVRPADRPLLDARLAARARYADVLASAGRWELPSSIRAAMRAWQFDEATTLIDDAEAILGRRAELDKAAQDAGLRLSPRLETVFESDAGFAAATAQADAEQAAIQIVADSAAARPAAPDLVVQLGLWGETPDARLAAARESFAAGELERAANEAIDAHRIWAAAGEVGRNRLMTASGVLLLVLLAIAVVVAKWRGRRRTRMMAHRLASVPPAKDRAPG